MRKYYLLLLVLLLIPLVNADTQIVKTSINVTANSWYDSSANQSRMNITVRTESAEEPRNYETTNVNSVSDSNFVIRVIRDMNCNQTDINKLVNQTMYYFTECDGQACKDGYQSCQSINTQLSTVKKDCESDLVGCKANKTVCDSDLIAKNNDFNILSKDNDKLQSDADKRWIYGVVGALIGACVIYFGFDHTNKNKPKQSGEEKNGVGIPGTYERPKDFYDGIGEQ